MLFEDEALSYNVNAPGATDEEVRQAALDALRKQGIDTDKVKVNVTTDSDGTKRVSFMEKEPLSIDDKRKLSNYMDTLEDNPSMLVNGKRASVMSLEEGEALQVQDNNVRLEQDS